MNSKILVAVAATLVSTGTFAADVKSISRLAFGPDNILFVADWKGSQVEALTLPAPLPKMGEGTFNIVDLEALLSKSLGAGKITVEDMAARPGSGEVYLAVSIGANKTPAIVVVTSDQKVRELDLAGMKSTAVTLKDSDESKYEFWKQTPERSFTVTDMKWHNGELFVAGLSNQNFASTLRRIPYPFTDKQTMTSVEIYHTTHNQVETRAPIRAMSFATLGGKPYVVAAYTCTPLVTIPLEDLKDGAHVKGKSIAELGYGNTPADMISYSANDPGGKPKDMLMLLNYQRSANIIPVSEVEAANEKPGIDKPVPAGEIAGVQEAQAALVGATRIDNLDDHFFIVVRRALETDDLQLVSIDKAMLFRLTDFVSEYDFPQYKYNNNAFQLKYFRPAHDMLMKQEGFPEFINTHN
ncbi:hypothetical protein [Pinirhizobacter sp.]|jgi:hypothetical protein|uniref:hypothetical protein n=1 Tax=Pinirhizobacter sp. TaxID=2950432 RepID=UPI002F420510